MQEGKSKALNVLKPVIYIGVFFVVLGLTYLSAPAPALAAQSAIDSSVNTAGTSHAHFGSNTVFVSDQTGYRFYRDSSGECVYSKTTNGGTTWGSAVIVDDQGSGTDCLNISVWYDQWTPGDTTGTTIHIVTMDSGTDDLWYNALDTSTDTRLTGSTAVNMTSNSAFAGTLAAGANYPAITKGTDGTIYGAVLDASDSTVVKCSSSCNTTTSWTEAGTNPFELAAEGELLLPLAGGNIMAIENDTSANDIKSQIWNGSSWSGTWTTVDANAIDNTTYDQNMDATLDPTTGDIYLAYVADDATPGTDDDIRTAIYSGGSWTLKTNVITNSVCAGVSNCGLTSVAIALDENTDNVYVAYAAETTAATTTSQNIYWKKSTDGMVTWGSESAAVNTTADDIYGVDLNAVNTERIYASWDYQAADDIDGDTIADLAADPPITVSGTIYNTDTTAYDCSANNLTVAIKVGGSGGASGTCTSSGGTYSISTSASSGAVITAYLDGETPKAAAVTKYDGSGNITGLSMVVSSLALGSDDGPTLTNTDLGAYDHDNDSDIPFTSNSGTLDLISGTNYNLVLLSSATTFAPGGTVTDLGTFYQLAGTVTGGSSNWDTGNFTLSGGTFTATSGTMYVGYESDADHTFWDHTAGTFNHNSGTVEIDIDDNSCSGAFDYDLEVPTSETFYNLTIDQHSGCNQSDIYPNTGESIIVNHTLNLVDGYLAGDFQIASTGSLVVGASADGGGTVTFTGSSAQTYSYTAGDTAPIIKVNKTGGAVTPAAGTTALTAVALYVLGGSFTAPTGNLQLGYGTDSFAGDYILQVASGATFTHNSGTLTVSTSTNDCSGSNHLWTIDAATTLTVNNLVIDQNNGCTPTSLAIATGDTLVVAGNLTLTNGYISGGTGAMQVQGNISVGSGFDQMNIPLTLTGSNAQTWTQSANVVSGLVTVNKTNSSDTVTLASNANFGGGLTITKGTVSQGASYNLTTGGTLTVAANGTWTNTGTGDITLGGNVSNSGTITLDGAGAGCGGTDEIALTSSNTTKRTWSGTGTFSLTDLAVSYMQGSMTAYSSTDSGNNTSWTFSACTGSGITVSGTIYSTSSGAPGEVGATPVFNCSSTNLTIKLKVNGSGTYSTTCTGSDGAYSISSVVIGAADDVIEVYISGETQKGAAVFTAADTSTNVSTANINVSYLTIRAGGSAVTNTDLDNYDSGQDSDVPFTVTSSNLTIGSGFGLFMTGDFTPGGTVTTPTSSDESTSAGNLLTQSGTTLSMSSNTLGIGGSVLIGGTFSASSGQTTNLTANTDDFSFDMANPENLAVTGTGNFTVANDVEIQGDLSVGTGATLSSTDDTIDMTVDGDVTGDGAINWTGDFTVTGTGDFGGDTDWAFNNLTFGDSTTTATTTATGTGSITVSGTLTVATNQTLNAGSKTWNLNGSVLVPTVTDNFNRADGGLGSNWTTLSVATAPAISSQKVGITATDSAAVVASASFTADQYAQVKLVGSTSSGGTHQGFGVILRAASGTGVRYQIVVSGSGTAVSRWDDDGTHTYLIDSSSITWAVGDVLRAEIVGTVITVKKNGTAVATYDTASDGTKLSSGQPGIVHSTTSDSSAGLDDFEAGDAVPTPLVVNGAFTAATSTVNIGSTAAVVVPALTYNNLEFTPVSGSPTYTAAGATTVNGDLTIGDGTNAVTFVAPSGNLTIGGDFTNNSTFTHNSGTVIITGSGTHAIGGDSSTTFNNFTDTAAGSTLTFANDDDGSTPLYTFAGTVTITGGTGNHITITSDNQPSDKWLVHFNNATSTITYVTVSYSDCGVGSATVTLGSDATDGGNNGTCWSFPTPTGITISGIIYSDEGTTAITSGPTVRIKVAGAGDYSATANGSGAYSIGSVLVSSGSVVTVYLDGATPKAVTVTRAADDSSDIDDLDLYQNYLIVRHEDSGPVTNTDLATYDGDDDADIPFTANDGALTMSAGTTLYVADGSTFSPGGDVSAVNLKIVGTYDNATSNPDLNVSGDLTIADGGVFTKGTGTTTFNKGGTQTATDDSAGQDLGQVNVGATITDPWWNTSWDARRKITFDNSSLSGSLTNFPVLVTLDSSNIDYSKTQNSGQDIRFVDSDGTTALSYEIEQWNESGDSYVWVKVPQLDNNNTDYIWMYYDNAAVSDGQAATAVWDSNYKGVWHLDETSGTSLGDSTSTGATFTTHNSLVVGATGEIGNGIQSTSGTQYASTAAQSAFNDSTGVTISYWFKPSSGITENYRGFNFGSVSPSKSPYNKYSLVGGPSGKLKAEVTTNTQGYVTPTSTTALSAGTWYNAAMTFDNSTANIYINGVLQGSVAATGDSQAVNVLTASLAGDGSHSMTGMYDEVRYSVVGRSADWIKAEYNTESGSMNTIGSEEIITSPTTLQLGSNIKLASIKINEDQTLDANGSHNLTVTGTDVASGTDLSTTTLPDTDDDDSPAWSYTATTTSSTSRTGSTSSDSFTAPANALLLLGVMYSSGSFDVTPTLTVSDSGGLTWTKQVERSATEGVESGHGVVFYTAMTTSSAARTVNVTYTGGASAGTLIMNTLEVITGVNPTAPIGAITSANEGGSTGVEDNTTSSVTFANTGLLAVFASDWDGGDFTSYDLQAWDNEDDQDVGLHTMLGFKAVQAGQNATASFTDNEGSLGTQYAKWVQLEIQGVAAPAHPTKRRKITFDNSGLSGSLTNFPVLVTLDSSTIDYSETQDEGQDLRFVDADGTTILPYEIEKWDETGTSSVWVKVPQLDNNDTDYIWMYYDDPDAAAGQTSGLVWDNYFRDVWHFNSIDDSDPDDPRTATSVVYPWNLSGAVDDNCTTAPSSSNTGTGLIGGGLNFTGTQCFGNDTPEIQGWLTLDGWIKTSDLGSDDQTFLLQGEDYPDSGFWLIDNGQYDSNIEFALFPQASSGSCGSTGRACIPRSSVNDGQWHKITGVYDGDNVKIYLDGELVDSQSAGSYTPDAGVNFGPDKGHDIERDEWRLSSTARSADWITAEYKTETSQMNTIGSEEGVGIRSAFDNDGTFTTSTGTVTFAPASTGTVTISGDEPTDFYNLTAATAGTTLQFKASQTIGVSGLLHVAGQKGSPVNLQSDSSGSQWTINLSGTATVAFITVIDSACAEGGNNIQAGETSVSRGNNGTCWIFVGRGSGSSALGSGPGGSGTTSGGGSGSGSGGSDNGNTATYTFIGATTIPHTGTTATIEAPKPDGAQAGDLAVVYLYVSDNTGTKGASGPVTGEDGWVFTNNDGVPVWDGSAYGRIFAYKVLDSSDDEESSFTFTFAGTTDISDGNGAGGRVYVYRGIYPDATVVSAGNDSYSSTGTSHTAPAVITPTDSSLVIVVAKAVNDSTTVHAPSGFTEDYNSGGRFSASKIQDTAGSTGTLSFTTGSDSVLSATIAVSLIQPAATGGGGSGGGGGGSP